MFKTRLIAFTFTVVITGIGAGIASGQSFPAKPVRIFAPAIGGGADIVARIIGQGLTAALAQQFIIENRGGNGVIAAESVAKAAPDGYTLLVFGSPIWLLPLLQESVPYDPLRDFAPVTLATTAPNILTVHPTLPVRSVKELIALAKARPGALNYAAGISGALTHLAGELFKSMANIKIVGVPYKGTALALNDLIAGQVQLQFSSAASVTPHINSGRLRALAVTSAQRSTLFPDLPTVAAILPGFEAVSIIGMFAPAKTPTAIIKQLNRESAMILQTAEVKQRFVTFGTEVVGSSPEEFAAVMKSETIKWGKVINDAGIRPNTKP